MLRRLDWPIILLLVGHSIHVKDSPWEQHDVSPVRIVEDLPLRLLCILLGSYRRVPRGLS